VTRLSKGRELIAEKRDTIGGHLRRERTRHGITVRALALRVGVSPSLLSQIETGRATPSIGTLYALVQELGLSLDELFTTSGERAEGEAGTASPGHVLETAQPFLLPTMVPVPPIPLGVGAPTQGPIYRAGTRKVIEVGHGVVWERLAGTADPAIDFVSLTFEPSASSGPTFLEHNGREYGLVLSGRLHVELRFDCYELGPGDSITFDSTVPHRLWNQGLEPARVIWVNWGHTP
jgi:transcriptional regulator with XRE-family HTH domain/mannose-6-phosphate isomerase-like protein (cupin superfamily)